MFDAIINTYHASSKTYIYIQLLIKRLNGTTMKECDNVIKHVNKFSIITKDSIVLGNLILHNMLVRHKMVRDLICCFFNFKMFFCYF